MQISLQDTRTVKIHDRLQHYRVFPRNRYRCQVLFSNGSANDLNLCWQVLFLQKMCERRSCLTRQPKKCSSELKSHWCEQKKKPYLLRFLNKRFYLLLNRSESNLNISINFPCFSLVSVNQNVTPGFNVFISIIRETESLVSTCVTVIRFPSCTKPNPGVAREAVILVVSNDADSRFGELRLATQNIKPFLVTVRLQGGLWANECLPRVTTQRGVSVFSVSDQWVKRAGLHIDYNESDLFTDLHTETDLGEGCVPVSRQLGLLWVESSLSSSSVVFSFITPVSRIIVKGTLGE